MRPDETEYKIIINEIMSDRTLFNAFQNAI